MDVQLSSKPTLISILNVFPICDHFCYILPLSDFITLTRTCKSFSALYQAALPRQWNVNKRLERFVKDSKHFRSQMGRFGALISGSFAIQFFERVLWKESDLDIFVEHGPDASNLEQYLCEEEGYRLTRKQSSEDSEEIYEVLGELLDVHTLVKVREDSTEAQIQIISTPAPPILAILKGFYTTLVVNVISWNKAYALYPQSSFLHHKTYLLKKMNDYFGKLLTKYETRGWQAQDVLWPEDEASHNSMIAKRRIGDRWTWIISLNNTGVARPEIPNSVIEYSGFILEKHSSGHLGCYHTHVAEFGSMVLKYKYTYLGNQHRPDFWADFAGPRLERLSLLELYKVPRSSRPQFIEFVLDGAENDPHNPNPLRLFGLRDDLADSNVKLPSYDNEIPSWHAQWEKEEASRIKPLDSCEGEGEDDY